jgi:3,4-dihydroxy 2-butanone 4-phosphate synthase/GTP cyclohydrolase II
MSSLLDVIDAFGRGEMVIVTDDDDRENEADLFVSAALCTPEHMAFMIRHTSGIVCAPMEAKAAHRLGLPPMVSINNAPLSTAFTVSVDRRDGLTTGISAVERAHTIRGLADESLTGDDFVRPGHIFPLISREGGVLMRSGHTEACVDLCRFAGLPSVGVLAELMNDDGTVMRGEAVKHFAKTHKLPITTIADMISFRLERETLVKRMATFPVETPFGILMGHAYTTPFDAQPHFAFVWGSIGDGEEIVTCLHRAHPVFDLFHSGAMIERLMDRFQKDKRGILIYLREGTTGVPLNTDFLSNPALPKDHKSVTQRWRDIGIGAHILKDLGVHSIVHVTHAQRAYVGLSGFGLTITGTEFLSS